MNAIVGNRYGTRLAAEYLEKFNVELKLHGTAARGSG